MEAMAVGSREDIADAAGDESLARRIQAGDRSAEDQFVRSHSARVFAMAVVRTRDREAVRELVDDVMMAALIALRAGKVRNTSQIGAFVHGTATNVINNYVRGLRRRLPTVTLDDARIDAGVANCETYDVDVLALRRCLAQLSTADRDVLTLSLVEGLKPADIALRSGQSAEVVRQQKSRALARLRQLLNSRSRSMGHEPQ